MADFKIDFTITNDEGKTATGSTTVSFPSDPPVNDGINPTNYARVIENFSTNGDVNLNSSNDNTLYVQPRFTGGTVKLTGCSNIGFLDMVRQGGSGDDRGIRLSNEGRCTDIIMQGGSIKDTPWDGISVAGDPVGGVPFHRNIQILDMLIDNTGLAGINGGLRHGIYAWGPVTIKRSVFKRSKGGNGISLRGGGTILDCGIEDAYESGIAYYGDHPAPADAQLIVEGNVIVGVNTRVATNGSFTGGASNSSDSCIYLKNVINTSYLVKTFRMINNSVDRANGVKRHSSYATVSGLSIVDSPNTQLTPAQCRALIAAMPAAS